MSALGDDLVVAVAAGFTAVGDTVVDVAFGTAVAVFDVETLAAGLVATEAVGAAALLVAVAVGRTATMPAEAPVVGAMLRAAETTAWLASGDVAVEVGATAMEEPNPAVPAEAGVVAPANRASAARVSWKPAAYTAAIAAALRMTSRRDTFSAI